MKILTRLNFVNFKQNRVRTAVTVVGVALSVMLILTVIGIATSIWYSVISDARKAYGDFHIMYEDVPGDKISVLENSKYLNVVFYSKPVDAVIDENGNKHAYWIGPYPTNSYETVYEEALIRDDEHEYNVFAKFTDTEDTVYSERMIDRELERVDLYYVHTRVNSGVVVFEGAGMSKASKILLSSLSALAIGTMAIIAAFIIRNSFNISITERVRQFGMLSSVGARPRQIRHMVYQEGIFIGLLAIPLGILLGAELTAAVVFVINNLLVDIMEAIGAEMLFFIPWQAMAITLVAGLIIVFLSAASPAIVASRYSPLFALRSNQDVKIKARKIRTSKLTRKIWGIGGVMARKNLKRSRQKYRTTVISIVLSVTAFVGVVSFMNYGHEILDTFMGNTGSNFTISGGSPELYDDVAKKFDLQKYVTYFDVAQYSNEESDSLRQTYVSVSIVSKDEFVRYAEKIKSSKTDYSHMAILFDNVMDYNSDGSFTYHRATKYEVGDTYKLRTAKYSFFEKDPLNTIDEEETDDGEADELTDMDLRNYGVIERKEEDITITAITDEVPLGYAKSGFNTPTIFIPEDYYHIKNIITDDATGRVMYIADEGKGDMIATYLDLDSTREKFRYDDDDHYYDSYDYVNTEKSQRTIRNLILLAEILIYGFIIIVSLIGITNIFNTITTNVALRAREFAIIKSVGMTSKEFNRMIRLESIMYSTRALLIGLPIGLSISYCVYKLFAAAGISFGWLIPWNAIIISVISVALLVAVIMRYSVHEIKKQNIIETIRKESF